MNAMAVITRMTAEEYLATADETVRSELVDGEVIVHGPLNVHQIIVMDLLFALRAWTSAGPGRGHASIPLDVRLDARNVFAPDLLWYAEGRGPARHDDRPYPLSDLAVEVRSPSTWRYDIGAKKSAYELAGLPELWLVDTAADVILVFRRSPKSPTFDVALEVAVGDELSSPQLPGFALAVRALFAA